ncbi:MAG: hypothetical protein EOM00_05045 [Clostridia bacterium]|nr:hypothetical protein [Clostridia bacterium]
MDNVAFLQTAIIVHAVVRHTANAMLGEVVSGVSQLPANCLHKLATGSFIAEMGIVPNPHLLFQKSNKNKSERTVMYDGDLPSGSEGHQPWSRTLRSSCFRLSELFPNLQ